MVSSKFATADLTSGYGESSSTGIYIRFVNVHWTYGVNKIVRHLATAHQHPYLGPHTPAWTIRFEEKGCGVSGLEKSELQALQRTSEQRSTDRNNEGRLSAHLEISRHHETGKVETGWSPALPLQCHPPLTFVLASPKADSEPPRPYLPEPMCLCERVLKRGCSCLALV